MEPKQWQPIIWVHVVSKMGHLQPLMALAGIVLVMGMRVVRVGDDGVVASWRCVRADFERTTNMGHENES
jgi:hypothetical protein